MGKHSRGYDTYRGRSGGSRVLKGIALVLGIFLIVSVGAFFFLERYLVYDDRGGIRLDLPSPATPTPVAEMPPPVVTIVPTPTPDPRPKQEELVPVQLDRVALYDGTAAASVASGGGNAAMFSMKEDSGTLGWVSDLPLAIAAKASLDDPAVNIAIRAAVEEEDTLYRIAKISCFKDHALPTHDTALAILTNSGYRWTDPQKVRWTSPAGEEVRNYLVGLCLELSALGFDEILLENSGYPTRGNLHYIRRCDAYDPERLETVVSGFYMQIAQALEGTDTRLSVVFDPLQSSLSGQTEAGIRAAGAVPVLLGEDGIYRWPTAAEAHSAGAQIPDP